jgi:hypothetical protein
MFGGCSRPQSAASGVSEQCGQQYENGHYYATRQYLVIVVLSIYSESPASVCHATSHCNVRCLSHLIPDEGLVLENPRKV